MPAQHPILPLFIQPHPWTCAWRWTCPPNIPSSHYSSSPTLGRARGAGHARPTSHPPIIHPAPPLDVRVALDMPAQHPILPLFIQPHPWTCAWRWTCPPNIPSSHYSSSPTLGRARGAGHARPTSHPPIIHPAPPLDVRVALDMPAQHPILPLFIQPHPWTCA